MPAANNPAAAQAQAKFQQGLALHQKGQLARAQEIYRQVLKVQPRHFDALHLLGVIAAQTKNFSQAVELIGRATRSIQQRLCIQQPRHSTTRAQAVGCLRLRAMTEPHPAQA